MACSRVLARGTARAITWSDDRVVVELECGVTVYPAREDGDRWRAVWYENGRRRQCESATEDGLAGRLEKVIERLPADAPNLERPGADLVAFYLCRGIMKPCDLFGRPSSSWVPACSARLSLPRAAPPPSQ